MYALLCLAVCIYVLCTHDYMYVDMYVCMFICMHICMYVCMYVCTLYTSEYRLRLNEIYYYLQTLPSKKR